jgi:hypothetical protein
MAINYDTGRAKSVNVYSTTFTMGALSTDTSDELLIVFAFTGNSTYADTLYGELAAATSPTGSNLTGRGLVPIADSLFAADIGNDGYIANSLQAAYVLGHAVKAGAGTTGIWTNTSAAYQNGLIVAAFRQVTPTRETRNAKTRTDTGNDKDSWLPSTGTELYPMVDETVVDDADYIYTLQPDACFLDLKPVVDPATTIGQSVTVRVKSDDYSTLIVTLMQGGKVIATRTYKSLLPTYQNFTMNLDQVEIDRITNYDNLQVKLQAARVT